MLTVDYKKKYLKYKNKYLYLKEQYGGMDNIKCTPIYSLINKYTDYPNFIELYNLFAIAIYKDKNRKNPFTANFTNFFDNYAALKQKSKSIEEQHLLLHYDFWKSVYFNIIKQSNTNTLIDVMNDTLRFSPLKISSKNKEYGNIKSFIMGVRSGDNISNTKIPELYVCFY